MIQPIRGNFQCIVLKVWKYILTITGLLNRVIDFSVTWEKMKPINKIREFCSCS